MDKYIRILFACLTLLTGSTHAATISAIAMGDVSSGLVYATNLIPVGTTVTADISMNVGPGTISTSQLTGVSGTFSWIDSTLGPQTFFANSAWLRGQAYTGVINIWFFGSGPTINNSTAASFSIDFNIGTNPFTAPGSTTELSELLVASEIYGMSFGATSGNTTHFAGIRDDISGVVSAVPLPGALSLFLSGLIGYLAMPFSYSAFWKPRQRANPKSALVPRAA